MAASVDEVREFWESQPLWTGESTQVPGSREFFDEHRSVVVGDCFAGRLDERLFPTPDNSRRVLDLGCGPGVWTIELGERGAQEAVAADLTENALELARRRAEIYGIDARFEQQNAESLTFEDGAFTHVNCQGVIHHTPDTAACVAEIARVLEPGGSALISVYYKNWILRNWKTFSFFGKFLRRLGARLSGRGRESIYGESDVDEIVRLYDGDENPIGKAYDRSEFRALLEPHFEIDAAFLHFFPARTLPFPIPRFLHRVLDARMGFMIFGRLTKRS